MPAPGDPADLPGSDPAARRRRARSCSGPGVTVGPPRCCAPALTKLRPVNPVSDEPIASVITTFGSAAVQASLTAGENSAALEEMATSDEAS